MRINHGEWQDLDFRSWPELVKEFMAGGGYLPKPRAKKPKPSAVDQRAEAAAAKLAEWQRKYKTPRGEL